MHRCAKFSYSEPGWLRVELIMEVQSDAPCLVTLLEDSIAAGGHKNITESYSKEVCAVAYGCQSFRNRCRRLSHLSGSLTDFARSSRY